MSYLPTKQCYYMPIKYYTVYTERNWGLTGNRAELPNFSHVWPQ